MQNMEYAMSTIKKWHINIHGIAAECGADKRFCPRGQDSDGDVDHFDTAEEANRVARERLIQKHGETATVTKRQPASAQPDPASSQRDKRVQRYRALDRKVQDVIQRATDAKNAASIKYQNIQHDEEMQIEEVNRMLPGNVQMTDTAGGMTNDDTPGDNVVSLTDQTYPMNAIIYDENSGNFAHYHYTQTGQLGTMTGGYRHSEEAQQVKQHLETQAVQRKIKELAMTRMKQQIAKRRETDLDWSRYDVQESASTVNSSDVLQRVTSVERFEAVPAEQQNQLTQSINALNTDVQVTEVKPRGGVGPSSYYINHDGEEGVDVTDVMTKYCTRHTQARPESADVHRDAAVVQLESLQLAVEHHQSRELLPNS